MIDVRKKPVQTTVYMVRKMPVELHTKLKMAAAAQKKTMESLHSEALELGLALVEANWQRQQASGK